MDEAMTNLLKIGFPPCYPDLFPQISYFFYILFLAGLLYLLPRLIIHGSLYRFEMTGMIFRIKNASHQTVRIL